LGSSVSPNFRAFNPPHSSPTSLKEDGEHEEGVGGCARRPQGRRGWPDQSRWSDEGVASTL